MATVLASDRLLLAQREVAEIRTSAEAKGQGDEGEAKDERSHGNASHSNLTACPPLEEEKGFGAMIGKVAMSAAGAANRCLAPSLPIARTLPLARPLPLPFALPLPRVKLAKKSR